MNLTHRITSLTLAIVFGAAVFLPATAASAEVPQGGPGPIPCEEWKLDEAGKPVCGPAPDEECDPEVEVCEETTPTPEPEPGPEPQPQPAPAPARPVAVQPSFTG